MKQGQPVELVYPDQGADEIGCFIVPNAAVLIVRSPHPESGKKLIDYLLSKDTEGKLASSDAAQIPLHPGVPVPPGLQPIESIKTMKANYSEIAVKLQAIQPLLKSWVGP
jgi:iron(III) transport system substrate-binding protein